MRVCATVLALEVDYNLACQVQEQKTKKGGEMALVIGVRNGGLNLSLVLLLSLPLSLSLPPPLSLG
jgi:invasion protein IalB